MIIVQNLVLNIGDWTELHGICVLKTAPKVSKRKTMLVVIHLSNFIKNYKIAIVIIYNFFYWPKKIKQKSTPTTNFSIYLSII